MRTFSNGESDTKEAMPKESRSNERRARVADKPNSGGGDLKAHKVCSCLRCGRRNSSEPEWASKMEATLPVTSRSSRTSRVVRGGRGGTCISDGESRLSGPQTPSSISFGQLRGFPSSTCARATTQA